MQLVITTEFVSVMVVPVTMDGTSNQIVQVILVSIDNNLCIFHSGVINFKIYEEESISVSNIVEFPGAGLSRLRTINSELTGAS